MSAWLKRVNFVGCDLHEPRHVLRLPAPAELFLAKRTKNSREKYRRFATAAEAIRYAVETLRTPKAFGASLEVGDERFNSSEILRLYEADDYPLRKPE
jgi:hypothetical protein